MTQARHDVLARTGVDRQHEHKTRGAARPFGNRGGCNRELLADDERRVHAGQSSVNFVLRVGEGLFR